MPLSSLRIARYLPIWGTSEPAALAVVVPSAACASLASIDLTEVGGVGSTITSATEGTVTINGAAVNFCTVEGTLAPAEAYKLAVALEARLIIPIHFAGLGEAGALKAFLKEAGEEKLAAVEKLTLKKKDLEGKEGEVAVLSASA